MGDEAGLMLHFDYPILDLDLLDLGGIWFLQDGYRGGPLILSVLLRGGGIVDAAAAHVIHHGCVVMTSTPPTGDAQFGVLFVDFHVFVKIGFYPDLPATDWTAVWLHTSVKSSMLLQEIKQSHLLEFECKFGFLIVCGMAFVTAVAHL